MKTDLEKTLEWIQPIAQFYIEKWDDKGNPKITISIDKNYISTYGGIGITFDKITGKFICFKIYE